MHLNPIQHHFQYSKLQIFCKKNTSLKLEQNFKDSRKSGTNSYITYSAIQRMIKAVKQSWTVLSCKYLQFYVILENWLQLVRNKIKDGRVEITYLFHSKCIILQFCSSHKFMILYTLKIYGIFSCYAFFHRKVRLWSVSSVLQYTHILGDKFDIESTA